MSRAARQRCIFKRVFVIYDKVAKTSSPFFAISVDETVTRIVHWPPPPPSPKEGEFVQKLESNTKAKAKYSKFNMEDEQMKKSAVASGI